MVAYRAFLSGQLKFSGEIDHNGERFTDSDKCTDVSTLIEETDYDDAIFRNHKQLRTLLITVV